MLFRRERLTNLLSGTQLNKYLLAHLDVPSQSVFFIPLQRRTEKKET